ncbi:MAG: DnaA/Hda family protein [Pseudomonadota bacterium]
MAGGSNTPQLALPLLSSAHQTLDSFAVGDNQELYDVLLNVIESADFKPALSPIFLYGPSGSGKSHLVFGLIRRLLESDPQIRSSYIALKDKQLGAELLSSTEPVLFNFIEDVDTCFGDAVLEPALFSFVERARQAKGFNIFTANKAATASSLDLKDLLSRLTAGLIYPLLPMREVDLIAAVKQRFALGGLLVDGPAIDYLLSRFSRDNHRLFSFVDFLDSQSLRAQRRITIPFLREQLSAYQG